VKKKITAVISDSRKATSLLDLKNVKKDDDSMKMIGHHMVKIEFNVWESFRQGVPLFLNHFPRFVQNHLTIHDFPSRQS